MSPAITRRINLSLGAMIVIVAAAAVAPGVALAYPEPAIVPKAWQLNFKWDAPGVIAVTPPGESTAQLYGYVPYTVTNQTDADQLFAPDMWVWTDAGDLMQANRGVSPGVFKAIKHRLSNPLLESPTEIVGRLLQGDDNAREGVIIWPLRNRDIDVVRIFIGGLSGETQEVEDPVTGKVHILRKTLALEYHTPGDQIHASQKPFVLKSHQWVMR